MASNRRLKKSMRTEKVRRVRRRDRFKNSAKVEVEVEEVAVVTAPPMPEGIERALQAMGTLVKHLRSKQTGPVTVNVELLEVDGEVEWALQVRGIKPPSMWEGFRTLWNNQCKPVWSSDW